MNAINKAAVNNIKGSSGKSVEKELPKLISDDHGSDTSNNK